jgi:hypothetical protein
MTRNPGDFLGAVISHSKNRSDYRTTVVDRECKEGMRDSLVPKGCTPDAFRANPNPLPLTGRSIFEDEDDDYARLCRHASRRPNQDTGKEYQDTAEDHLENGREQWCIHEMIPDPSDDSKLDCHHDHGDEGSQ